MESASVLHRGLTCLLVGLIVVAVPMASAGRDDEPPGLGPPPLYDALITGELEPSGRIQDGHLTVDRFEFELTDGELYLLRPLEGQVAGSGVPRRWCRPLLPAGRC